MPPKASKKTQEKAKQKTIEDKTFGLKNKNKSTKVQKYVQNVTKTVTEAGAKKKANEPPKKSKAELEEEKKKELAQLFKVTQTVKPGVDPKSVVCEFFKMGMCTKGEKCKFAHDLMIARKAEKIDIYTDRRNVDAEKKDDMESGNWDQTKLEQVVAAKETAHANRPVTDIICKYFLEALETKKYGWFWTCPNGGEKCQYRHALPPGYVLKEKGKKDLEPEEEKTPLEELIEEERKKLTKRTPVTKENFEKWSADKAAQKKRDAEEADKKRKADLKSGRTPMSGKEMFEYHPELFVDDDEAFQADDYVNNNPDEAGVVPEIIVTATGTSITLTRKERPKKEGADGAEAGKDGEGDPEVENAELFNADEIPDDLDGEEGGQEEAGEEEGGEEEEEAATGDAEKPAAAAPAKAP